jgi:hypothetical protein
MGLNRLRRRAIRSSQTAAPRVCLSISPKTQLSPQPHPQMPRRLLLCGILHFNRQPPFCSSNPNRSFPLPPTQEKPSKAAEAPLPPTAICLMGACHSSAIQKSSPLVLCTTRTSDAAGGQFPLQHCANLSTPTLSPVGSTAQRSPQRQGVRRPRIGWTHSRISRHSTAVAPCATDGSICTPAERAHAHIEFRVL